MKKSEFEPFHHHEQDFDADGDDELNDIMIEEGGGSSLLSTTTSYGKNYKSSRGLSSTKGLFNIEMKPMMMVHQSSSTITDSPSTSYLNTREKADELDKEEENSSSEYYEEGKEEDNFESSPSLNNILEGEEGEETRESSLPTIEDVAIVGEGEEGTVKRKKGALGTLTGCWDSFVHSQFYVHMLMFSTLLTFGGMFNITIFVVFNIELIENCLNRILCIGTQSN